MTIQFPHMPEQITRSEAEIIDYISNTPREFLQDSIGAVGQKLGVSGTTLSRFARRVGCGDYKGLKRLVSQQEQPAGPAAKLLEIQQGFTVESWMLRQQLYLEKTLEEGIEDFDVREGAFAIAMDPNTGAILGIASSPDFDPNNYSLIADSLLSEEMETSADQIYEQLKANNSEGLTDEELRAQAESQAYSDAVNT